MKIIVVEDDETKLEYVTEFLKSEYQEDMELEVYKSYRSGLKGIFEGANTTDLILLDMSMNTYDITAYETGGRKRAYAGRDILDQMKWNEVYLPVVVVTQFETFEEYGRTRTLTELCSDLERLFPEIYLGYVYFDSSQNNWREDLKIFISRKRDYVAS